MMPFFLDLLLDFKIDCETYPDGRFYCAPSKPDDMWYPSVTTVLRYAMDKQWLEEWRNAVGNEEADRISGRSLTRGEAIHRMMERYVLSEYRWGPDLDNVMPINYDMFSRIIPVLDKHLTVVKGVELQLWSHRLRTAGKADLVGDWDNETVVLDLKGSSKPKKPEDIGSYFVQATTYALMVNELYGLNIEKVVILLIPRDEPAQVFIRRVEDWKPAVERVFLVDKRSEPSYDYIRKGGVVESRDSGSLSSI